MKKKKYYLGSYVKDSDLFANVHLIHEIHENFSKFSIIINFEKDYTWQELRDKGIHLKFYYKSRGKWIFNLDVKGQLLPEINRLNKLGFDLLDIDENSGVQKFLATLI